MGYIYTVIGLTAEYPYQGGDITIFRVFAGTIPKGKIPALTSIWAYLLLWILDV